MESITQFRQQLQQLAAQATGARLETPTLYVGQRQADAHHAELAALPVDLANVPDLMDLDPGSPTFGRPYFMPDYDAVDSAPIR